VGIGAGLHEQFGRNYAEGAQINPKQAARSLLRYLSTDAIGEIWKTSDQR
jgi:hypothetical protein